ncbi:MULTISPECIES: hypothetical protein [unclassified Treponema]|uniref:hypothetical protein n=1 Tax=unclassified Treponema TaxID=2638727 RepID=UPI0020A35554|nr:MULTISPECIES: hypothetical protein [unclassified Treponema]UTC66796.1 hypothetical protein E4O06_12740 [Treponema sp. OMZ 789]UTC69529.1 hypothetical protein E4O01_12880 [Treponema sp. OMZ 790]UTC72243.1 hypothetical protein E4O02_12975 [Treponema sp. OMZ 791]
MTTKKFAKYMEKQCKGINNFSLESLFGEYIVLVSGKRVGVLYQEKFYVLYAPTFKKPENVLRDFKIVNLFDWRYYQFIEVGDLEDKDRLIKIIEYVYHELYFLKEVVIDIEFLFQSYRGYPEIIHSLYDEHLTFLRFAYEKKLLKVNPVDIEGRIIKFSYTNLDLTETGHKILDELYDKWLIYTDKNDADSLKRARNVKQLEKYYQKLMDDFDEKTAEGKQ